MINQNQNSIAIYYQNVRILNSKTKNFYLTCSSADYDIICLTETWLNPSVNNSELFNQNYNVYRCDRSPVNSLKSRSGGVLIAVRSSISSKVIQVAGAELAEIVFVKCSLPKQNLFICCLYIPSNIAVNTRELYTQILGLFLETVDINISDTVLVLGDFNFPSIQWVDHTP